MSTKKTHLRKGLNRRQFLQGLFGTAALTGLMPGLAFARAETDMRLIVVILRGGLDGLSAAVPYADPGYTRLRGDMALPRDSLLILDDMFGLNPALEILHDLYLSNQMLVVHALASPYRERSHFDAQNVLELGSEQPNQLRSGWLNRLAAAIDSKNNRLGLSVGSSIPLVMQGEQPVGSWAPSALPEANDTFFALARKIYARDPVFAQALEEGMALEDKADMLFHGNKDRQMARRSVTKQGFPILAEAAGSFLDDPEGPRLAVLEMGGWDTHINQGVIGGQLAGNLMLFGNGIKVLKENMKGSWNKTVVVAMTEFGRTARPNGSGGTDHGTGGAAFVFGGAVNGGRVITRWPGLDQTELFQNRDLMPTIDIRAMMKGILHDMYGLSDSALNHDIYPGSGSVERMRGLVRI